VQFKKIVAEYEKPHVTFGANLL